MFSIKMDAIYHPSVLKNVFATNACTEDFFLRLMQFLVATLMNFDNISF